MRDEHEIERASVYICLILSYFESVNYFETLIERASVYILFHSRDLHSHDN